MSTDLDLMYEHILRTRQVASLPPFKDIIARELNPGPEVTTEEDIKAWIRKSFMTIYRKWWYHLCLLYDVWLICDLDTIGSNSMLPKEKGGVVSPELKVYGTTNLRVVDISILPLHIGANTQCMFTFQLLLYLQLTIML